MNTVAVRPPSRAARLALCLLASVPWCAAQTITALFDDFSDGNSTANPTWEAGDLHWYNPFFIEQLNGKWWAGSRRYGSFGASFAHPDRPGWPILLDVRRAPVSVSFLALFRTSTEKDAIAAHVIGPDSSVGIRLTPAGSLITTWRPFGPGDGRVFQDGGAIPRLSPGEATRVAVVLGGPDRFTLALNGKRVYRLAPRKVERADPLLTRFRRIALMGALRVQEPNIQLLVPEMQDTRAYRWVTEIRVRGVPEAPASGPFPELNAAPRSVLLFLGPAAVGTRAAAGLRDDAWGVTTVYDHEPLRREPLRAFREHLSPDTMSTHEWVVLFDIHAQRLGLDGCRVLARYLDMGGKLLVLGGACTLTRGAYFDSPLALCLPISSRPGHSDLVALTDEPRATIAFPVQPISVASRVRDHWPLWEKAVGAGRVRVLTWATLGSPDRPFWTEPNWLSSLLTATPGTLPGGDDESVRPLLSLPKPPLPRH